MATIRPGFLCWDIQNTVVGNDVNLIKFAAEILELVASLKSIKLSLARGYHSGALSSKQLNEISKLGYELLVQDPTSNCPDCYLDILLYLLDNRINISMGQSASIIIVTSNSNGLQSLVQRLRQRGIHVVLISTKAYDGYMIDVDIFYNIEELFQASRQIQPYPSEKPFLYLSTSDDVLLGPHSSTKSPGALAFSYDRSGPNTRSPGGNFRDAFDFAGEFPDDYKGTSSRYRLDTASFNPEESSLYSELYASIQSRNTRVTVAVLRKIYTKQTRGFRIPDLLREMFPMLGENGILTNPNGSAYILFTLSCVQWCLGMPSGEKPDSYKYKMNKNIARWLLKELQRKGIPSLLPADVAHAAYSVIAHILEHNVEPDFAQELAGMLGISSVANLTKTQQLTPRSSNESPMQGFETKFTFDIATGTISATQTPTSAQQSAAREQETYAQFKDFLQSNMSIQQVHAAIPKMGVDHRLFLLVAKSPGGLLGARIPSLYREVFGERLRLQGRKLKDILMTSGQVEMIGTDGPGDKLFRLISDTYNAPSYHDHMLDPRSGVFESHDSFGVPPMSDSLDGSILGRFRGFPRDEGSQLDKLIASLSLPSTGEIQEGDEDEDEEEELAERKDFDFNRYQGFGMGQF